MDLEVQEYKDILTPKKVIRNFCFECVGKSSWQDIDSCGGAFADKTKMCPFHKYRLKKKWKSTNKDFSSILFAMYGKFKRIC